MTYKISLVKCGYIIVFFALVISTLFSSSVWDYTYTYPTPPHLSSSKSLPDIPGVTGGKPVVCHVDSSPVIPSSVATVKNRTIHKAVTGFPFPNAHICSSGPLFYGSETKQVNSDRHSPNNRRVAVVIRGEAFRDGGRRSRNTCQTETSRIWQQIATKLHLKNLIQPLKKLGNHVDIFFATYGCPSPNEGFIDDLAKWYGDDVRGYVKVERVDGRQDQATTINAALQLLSDYSISCGVSYEGGVIMIRFDYFLLADFRKMSFAQHLGEKLLKNSWGGGDIIFGVPWYFMNCFAGVFRHTTCFNNHYESGWNCWHAIAQNLVVEDEQVVEIFIGDECGQPCSKNNQSTTWYIHPFTNPDHSRAIRGRLKEIFAAGNATTVV